MAEEYCIGIDLGTTTSRVAVWRNNLLEIIPNNCGDTLIPSYVAFTNVNRYVGMDAKNQADLNPKNVFYEVKRYIGRLYSDPIIETAKDFVSYEIASDDQGKIILKSEYQSLTPEEIQATILSKLKKMASDYLNQKITKAVVAIPAYFLDNQRQAIKDACTIAGIDCIKMINEPTAAGLSYGLLNRSVNENKKLKVIIYDFGGGTLDVTLLSINNGTFKVIASAGNSRLGGSDFDTKLMCFCIAKFKIINKLELTTLLNVSIQKLRNSCEQEKKILSINTSTFVAVKNFYNSIDLCIKITRSDFENICCDLFILSLLPITDILKECNLSTNEIADVILVGGMTKIPKIRDQIKFMFNKEPNCSINPEEAVVAGTAMQAYILFHDDDPFSNNVTIMDTTTLSIGIETIGGMMDVIIPRNTLIPTSESRVYTTDTDNIEFVTIKIFEGERQLTKDNYLVGEFELRGIKKTMRGIPEINVVFNINNNKIVTITATYENNTSSLIISENKLNLSKLKINKLIEEAKEFEIKDETEKEKKILHYKIDDMCSTILFNIQRPEIVISSDEKNTIKKDIEETANWLIEKKYFERSSEEFSNKFKEMTLKYGVLIGRNNDSSKIDGVNQTNGTSIYNDDECEENIIKTIEDTELCITDNKDKEELKELKLNINTICSSIIEIIDSPSTKLSDDDKLELRNFIDDTLLWVCIHTKPTIEEYKIKLIDINNICDIVMNKYNNDIYTNNSKETLEKLCLTLKTLIDDEKIIVKNKDNFINIIEETLEWIYSDEATLENKCHDKINMINSLCQEEYIITSNAIESQQEISDDGTDILTLVKDKQKDIIDDLLRKS